jgi:sarcosine oxidase delta subunit
MMMIIITIIIMYKRGCRVKEIMGRVDLQSAINGQNYVGKNNKGKETKSWKTNGGRIRWWKEARSTKKYKCKKNKKCENCT